MSKKRSKALIVVSVILVGVAAACGLRPEVLPKGEDKSKVMISAGDAVTGEGLSIVSVSFIPGRDNPDGEAVCQAVSGDVEGTGVELPCGEYTVQWSADGYHTRYQNMEVRKEEVLVRKWMMPVFEGDAAYILMEWESETDLDLCVYNEQTGRCLGRETTQEDAGSFSHGDNDGTKGYELAFLKDYDKNAYAIYVKDNGAPVEGQGAGGEPTRTTVSIYTSDGLLYQKEPEGKEGEALWHCADIDQGQIREQDEYVHDLTEHAWAMRSKDDPESWIEGAGKRSEETYYYKAHELCEMAKNSYDLYGNWIAHYEYDGDGNVTYRDKREYDETGKLLVGYEQYDRDGNMTYYVKNEYDEAGNLLTGYHHDFLEKCIQKDENAYDSDGRKVYKHSYQMDEDGTILSYEEYEYKYDANGKEIVWRFYEEGILSKSNETKYDKNGNELFSGYYDEDGTLYTSYISEYDINGNIVRRSEYWGDMLTDRYEYDQNGNELFRGHYNIDDGTLYSSYISEYDINGNIVCRYVYLHGWLRHKDEYDLNGNCIRTCFYDEQGDLESRSESEYDENGRLAAKHYYDGDGKTTGRESRVYDENGRSIEYCEYSYGILKRKVTWEFDEKGICTHSYAYHPDYTSIYDYTYEFDAVGGMRIDYYYSTGVLSSKTITLFY